MPHYRLPAQRVLNLNRSTDNVHQSRNSPYFVSSTEVITTVSALEFLILDSAGELILQPKAGKIGARATAIPTRKQKAFMLNGVASV